MKFSYFARSGILRSRVFMCDAKEPLSAIEPDGVVELSTGRTWAELMILLLCRLIGTNHSSTKRAGGSHGVPILRRRVAGEKQAACQARRPLCPVSRAGTAKACQIRDTFPPR